MRHQHHYTVEQANARSAIGSRRGSAVDFPAMRDGREVYLCRLVEEPEIAFWHEPEAGFGGRRPL
jgi:hypothetical protein